MAKARPMIRKRRHVLPFVAAAFVIVIFASVFLIEVPRSVSRVVPVFAGDLTVDVFYGNSNLDPELNCEAVFPVKRRVNASSPELSAVGILLQGPTDEEKAKGYFASLNHDIEIQSFEIREGVAWIDFSERLVEDMGGACRAIAVRAEIVRTLKQFPNVTDVVISVNGRTTGILEP